MKSKEEKSNPIYPEGLKTGDQVCIIDPANAFTEEALDAAASHLEARGLKVTVSEDMAFRRGTPKERAEKLNRVIEDPRNRGIFCIWGGYGTIPLLDKINYDALSKNRPIFTGFSDITAMHLAIGQKTGLVTYHGPSFLARAGRQRKRHCVISWMCWPRPGKSGNLRILMEKPLRF
ncbi:MAG: LD-carboxypeptidase [[Clostridium] scindens]